MSVVESLRAAASWTVTFSSKLWFAYGCISAFVYTEPFVWPIRKVSRVAGTADPPVTNNMPLHAAPSKSFILFVSFVPISYFLGNLESWNFNIFVTCCPKELIGTFQKNWGGKKVVQIKCEILHTKSVFGCDGGNIICQSGIDTRV